MLQWINDRVKHFGWILLAPIALTFVVWGVHGIADFSTQSSKGLKVNGVDVPVERIRRAYQEQMSQLRRFIPDGELPAALVESTRKSLLDRFVGSALLDGQAEAQKYIVTDQQVIDAIHQIPAFQVGGQFNRDAYEAALRQEGYTWQRFEAEERQSLRSRQLEGGLAISAFLTPQEYARTVALEKETRETSWVLVPAAKYAALVHPDDKALNDYYEAHKERFMTADTVALDYVELKLEAVASVVDVSDTALRAYYDTLKDRYVEPEKRRARHILVEAGSDPARAEEKAKDLYRQATAPGADFAALAKANSQDPGSAPQGGDLGWAEKSSFVGPFADALYAMQPGEIRGPIRTQFGWHVIKLEEVKAGQQKSFEEVRPSLEAEYRRNEAEKRFGEQQEKLDTLAFENAGSLEPVAKALGLTVRSIPDYTRAAGGGGLPPAPKLVAAAFSADVLGGQNSRAIELSPGDVVVVRAGNHRPPVQQTRAEVEDQVQAGARDEAATAAAAAAASSVVAAVRAGKPFAEAIAVLGPTRPFDEKPDAKADAKTDPAPVRYQPPRSLTRRMGGIEPALLAAVFRAPAAADVRLGKDSVAFVVSGVTPGVVNPAATQDLRPYTQAVGASEIGAYVATLRAKAKVSVDPKLFE
jgi:peptidyl-prolyl cis-trans isomerase D